MKNRIALILIIGWVGGCSKPAHLPEQTTDDPSARTTTAVNPPSTPQEMAVRCDVPFYEGAQAPDGMSRMPHRDTDGNTHYELVLTTPDSPPKVASFYAKSLNLRNPPPNSSGSISLVGKTPHKNDLIIEVDSEGGHTVIRIHSIAYKSS